MGLSSQAKVEPLLKSKLAVEKGDDLLLSAEAEATSLAKLRDNIYLVLEEDLQSCSEVWTFLEPLLGDERQDRRRRAVAMWYEI